MSPFALLAALLTGALGSRVCAAEADAAAVVPILIGDAVGASTLPVTRSPSLSPGQVAIEVIAEVPNPKAVTAGKAVDIWLKMLGGESGIHADPLLRNVKVISARRDSAFRDDDGGTPRRLCSLSVSENSVEKLRVASAQGVFELRHSEFDNVGGPFQQVLHNFVTNLFQPLLLFFFMGFSVPLLRVPFEFPKQLYQSLTIYLLVAIGWHGGVLMASQPPSELKIAGGLAVVGFLANTIIGVTATVMLRKMSRVRRIDAVTVGAYYGSDSAGTFVTCLGILAVLGIAHDSYMPVLLAVMEIPGCLVGLYLVSRLRRHGMDARGNMPDEPGYDADYRLPSDANDDAHGHGHGGHRAHAGGERHAAGDGGSVFSWKILHEVFLNPGLFLLFGGIIVGFIAGQQALSDPHVVDEPNHLFTFIFKGALCLFLLEMGMTACRHLRDLKTAGIGYVLFGLLAPTLFATFGMVVLHAYSVATQHMFQLGTYALFACLCGAASYIAVPAVQRLAIPEASPTLPLAASLGLTFSWNVTLGIPIYIEIAKAIVTRWPVS